MYKIIGGDSREYGPVTTDQIRQWFREGRANAQTRVQPAGSTDWKLLGEVTEFADLFGAPATAAVPPPIAPSVAVPPSTAGNAAAITAEALARDYRVKTGEWIGRGWDLIKRDFWLLVGASFVAGLIQGLGIIGFILGGPMMGGLYGLYLKKIRGQPASFEDAFVGFSVAFVPLMLAYIVSGLLGFLGLLFCLVPGIYLLVAWCFAVPLVFDKHLDFWEAMEVSRKVVSRHWWGMFWFLLVCGLLIIGGLFACCVGIFVTTALAQAATLYAYEDIFGSPTPTA